MVVTRAAWKVESKAEMKVVMGTYSVVTRVA
jgi:hypothetical protein